MTGFVLSWDIRHISDKILEYVGDLVNRDTVGSRLILEVKEISKSFPGVQALDRVDMDVEREGSTLFWEERIGKVDAHKMHCRSLSEGFRDYSIRREGNKLLISNGIFQEGNKCYLSGEEPHSQIHCRAEHIPR